MPASKVTRELVMKSSPQQALKKYPWTLLEYLFKPNSIAHRMLRCKMERYELEFASDLARGVVPAQLRKHYEYVLRYDVPAEHYYRLLRDARNDPLPHLIVRNNRRLPPKPIKQYRDRKRAASK